MVSLNWFWEQIAGTDHPFAQGPSWSSPQPASGGTKKRYRRALEKKEEALLEFKAKLLRVNNN